MKNHYKILEIPNFSNEDIIKKAFKKLVLVYHPDKNPDNKECESKFKEIVESYEFLMVESNRYALGTHLTRQQGPVNRYIDLDEDLFNSKTGHHHFNVDDFFGGFGIEDAKDSVERLKDNEFIDWMKFRNTPKEEDKKGENIEIRVEIDFKDSIFGCEKEINFKRINNLNSCSNCNGTGFKYASINKKCKECSGIGRLTEQSRVTIRIPPNVKDGSRLVVKSLGQPGAVNGDLILIVSVKSNLQFEKIGYDAHIQFNINLRDHILGGSYSIMNLEGKMVEISVPKGSKSGEKIILKNLGFTKTMEERGDIVINLVLSLPNTLSDRGVELLNELMKEVIS